MSNLREYLPITRTKTRVDMSDFLAHQKKEEERFNDSSRQADKYRCQQGWILSSLVVASIFFSACNGNDTTSNANTPVISNAPKTSLPMPPLNHKSITNMGWSLGDGKRNAF